MTKTITRVYDDYLVAENTVRDLEHAGLGSSHIGIVASNIEGWHKPGGGSVDPKHDKDRDGKDDRAEGAETGGGIGAILGGAAGAAVPLRVRLFFGAQALDAAAVALRRRIAVLSDHAFEDFPVRDVSADLPRGSERLPRSPRGGDIVIAGSRGCRLGGVSLRGRRRQPGVRIIEPAAIGRSGFVAGALLRVFLRAPADLFLPGIVAEGGHAVPLFRTTG